LPIEQLLTQRARQVGTGRVIRGWDEALLEMSVGEERGASPRPPSLCRASFCNRKLGTPYGSELEPITRDQRMVWTVIANLNFTGLTQNLGQL
jgi:hypothetical protein